MLSVLSKLGSAAIVGQFALGLAVAAPIFMFTNLQLRAVQATDSRSEFSFGDYFTLRCMATGLGLAVVVAIILFSQYDRQTSLILLLIAGAKAVESLSDVTLGLMQKHERLDQLATSLAIKGVASILVFTTVFWQFRSLPAAVAAMGITWLLVFLAYDFLVARRTNGPGAILFKTNVHILKRLTLLSLPLGFVMAIMSLNTNIPRYILQHYKGPSEFGIFASLAYLGTASSLVINALGQSAAARLSRMFADQQLDAFKSMLGKFVWFGLAIGLIGVPAAALWGRFVLSLVYRPEYAHYLHVFLVMVATTSVLAVASFLGYGLTAARSFKIPLVIISISTLTTVVLSVKLIPRFGLMGAALALLAGAIAQVIGFTIGIVLGLKAARRMATIKQTVYASEFEMEAGF
jgi:O-antigen/teichoic acid export membrane protein